MSDGRRFEITTLPGAVAPGVPSVRAPYARRRPWHLQRKAPPIPETALRY